VAICDFLGHDRQMAHISSSVGLADIVPPAELPDWLKGRRLTPSSISGAISETTATDADLMIETNFRTVDAAARLVHRQRDAVHLRVVGRDLWRRRPGISRRSLHAMR